MRLVLDTNILLSALLRDSTCRKIVLNPILQFLIPDFALSEINKYFPEFIERAGVAEEDFRRLFSLLMKHIEIISASEYANKISVAEAMITDKNDAAFLALALTIDTKGILTEEKHFLKQSAVRVWTVKDILTYLEDLEL